MIERLEDIQQQYQEKRQKNYFFCYVPENMLLNTHHFYSESMKIIEILFY